MSRENRTRRFRHELTLDEVEERRLKKRMKEVKATTFQNYARKLVLYGAYVNFDFSELLKLRMEINRIGQNINQIAKHVNVSDEVTREDMGELRRLLLEANEQLGMGLRDVKRIKKSEEEKGWEKFKEFEDLINNWL